MTARTGETGGGHARTGVQVTPDHYLERGYDTRERFVSYWHQIDSVLALQPRSVLEVGVGNGFVADYLSRRGLTVWSIDHDSALQPSITGALDSLPVRSRAVDVLLCAEVLEHVPFATAMHALAEFSRVAREGVVVSVPNATPAHRALLPIPFIGERRILLTRWWIRPSRLTNPEEHHWEVGLPRYPLRRLRAGFRDAGLELVREFRMFENPYHHFFLLRPRT